MARAARRTTPRPPEGTAAPPVDVRGRVEEALRHLHQAAGQLALHGARGTITMACLEGCRDNAARGAEVLAVLVRDIATHRQSRGTQT